MRIFSDELVCRDFPATRLASGALERLEQLQIHPRPSDPADPNTDQPMLVFI